AGLFARHDLAVARQARRPQHGRPRPGDLLVRAALAADVPDDAVAAAARLGLLASAGAWLRSDDPALPGDGRRRAAAGASALVRSTCGRLNARIGRVSSTASEVSPREPQIPVSRCSAARAWLASTRRSHGTERRRIGWRNDRVRPGHTRRGTWRD